MSLQSIFLFFIQVELFQTIHFKVIWLTRQSNSGPVQYMDVHVPYTCAIYIMRAELGLSHSSLRRT